MEHIAAWKVISFCYFSLAGRFFSGLRGHDAGTFKTKLYAGIGVNRIVDTAVTGQKTSQKLTVGSIDNGVGGQCCDIALPEILPGSYGG